jgi:hypothetical protein
MITRFQDGTQDIDDVSHTERNRARRFPNAAAGLRHSRAPGDGAGAQLCPGPSGEIEPCKMYDLGA